MSKLIKREYKNLSKKVNNGYLPVDYFRKNFFNNKVVGSGELKKKKIVYEDKDTTIKIDRELNQKHRDLLSLLFCEKNEKPNKDGSYIILTNVYALAKKMGYSNPKNCTNRIYNLLENLAKTRVSIVDKNKKTIFNYMLIGKSFYDKVSKDYKVEIPVETSKYIIYTTCVLMPKEINQKIVNIPDNKSKLKALISFMLSNKLLKNGIFFDTICTKLEIVDRYVKSRFKKLVKENLDLLEEFKISFKDDKFYLDEQIVDFERAITDKDIKDDNYKKWLKNTFKTYNESDKKLCKYKVNGEFKDLYIKDFKLHIMVDNILIRFSNDNKVEESIFKNLYEVYEQTIE